MLKESPLGKATTYIETYAPALLFPVPRRMARDQIGIQSSLPFQGIDIWNGYEISWLNPKGKPEIRLAEFIVPCTSTNIIESKSLKMYLNSFNQTQFAGEEEVYQTLVRDLCAVAEGEVGVRLFSLQEKLGEVLVEFSGTCIDDVDMQTDIYQVHPASLRASMECVEEDLYSHLLKSNCLATGQPDWGTVQVRYSGPRIDRAGLLQYIVSFRNHSGFHEDCVERMFTDIARVCRPDKLTVYARYTRRGGLDINPFRSNFEKATSNARHVRQ